MQTEFDIVVYGATGFTGRLAAERLARVPQLRFAIAGRSRPKLEALSASLPQRPSVLVAEAHDKEAIRSLVSATRVVANFAGPFSLYAETMVATVAELGRCYCDITGETPFVRRMLSSYEETAQASGATLIPFSGFDSVPAELLVWLADAEADKKAWELDELIHYYRFRGGLNGGTLASALSIAENRQGQNMMDPNTLILDPAWPRPPRFPLGPAYEPVLSAWSSLFFMHPVNAAVVRRAQYLSRHPQREARAKRLYIERQLLGSGWSGRARSYGNTAAFALFSGLSQKAWGRRLIKKLGPEPGEGPSHEARQNGFYQGQLIAREKGLPRLLVTLEASGDPGNAITIAAATSVARLLASPKPRPKGFVTPMTAFGEHLVEELKAEGFRSQKTYL